MIFSESPTIAGHHSTAFVFPGSHSSDPISTFGSNAASLDSSDSRLSQNRQIFGNRNRNSLRGQSGDDTIRGRAGNDLLKGLAGNDKLYGEGGNDRMLGGTGNDWLNGSTGRNILKGEAGNDQIIGGKQTDQIVGGLGDDKLMTGGGKDQITGGGGRDRFVLTSGMKQAQLSNVAAITDFKDGEDFLELVNLKFADLAITQGTGQMVQHTLIQNKATGETLVILKNIQSANITPADFWGEPVSTASPTPVPAPMPTPSPTPDSTPLPTPSPTPDPTPLPTPSPTPGTLFPATSAVQSSTIKFSPGDSEATIAATGAAKIQIGNQTIYIGTQQVSSDNQNPVIVSFDSTNPANNWTRTDYEITGADGRGYGLFWSGSQLYGVFSVDGTQGTADQDFRRVSGDATQSWLRSYGAGGGAKVAVLAQINLATGEMTDAVYLSAILSNGNSNSLAITGLSTNAAGNVVVEAQSYFAPRRPDGKAMTQLTTETSPFDYKLEITSDLKTVINTSAVGWS